MTKHPIDKGANTAMGIFDHLEELRSRLLWALLTLLIVVIMLFPFAKTLYHWVALPILHALPADTSMIATDITSTFFAPFKLSLTVSLFISIPILIYHTWAFVAPGLYPKERRFILPVVCTSSALFYCGIAFAYFAVFPIIMAFFTNIAPEGIKVSPDISQYLTIALKLFFAFGLAFQVPIIVAILLRSRIMTVRSLKEKRPYIVVGCFIFAMLMTPPDPFSQSILAVPMWMLFELGLLIGRLITPQSAEEANNNEEHPS